MSLIIYVLGIENCILESLNSLRFFTKYLCIAVFCAWLIPYIEEIFCKSVEIRFRVESRQNKKNENSEEN